MASRATPVFLMDTFEDRLQNLHKSIKLHITILSQKFPASPQGQHEEAKVLLTQTVAHIRHLVTKFALVCGQTTDMAVVGPVCEQLEQASAGLVQALQNVLMEAVAGKTLTASVVAHGTDILEALATVVQGLLKKVDNIPVLTSVVWNGLDKLKTLPLDNKTAVFKTIQNYSRQVKDAHTELTELGEDNAVNSLSQSDEDEFEFQLDQEGKLVVPPCVELVKLTYMTVVQVFCKAVNEIPLATTAEQRDWLEEMRDLVSSIGSTVDDLSETIYPPQDKLALAVAFDKLKELLDKGLKSLSKEKFSEALNKIIPLVEGKVNAVSLP